MISRLLIANRGEIAARVARTCERLGVEYATVWVGSDRLFGYHERAYAAAELDRATGGHLDAAGIVSAAKELGCDAIHPGYGFLSENPGFARLVEEAGLVFVGPDAEVIANMADKAAARKTMAAAGVPVLPGTTEATDDLDELERLAPDVGFPLMVKPAAGGGGKGMSVVTSPAALRSSLASAVRTATAAFGDGRLLLERYVEKARHVEVQVFGDRHGNVVHLFDRDCSLQRRHQKIIEEAPAPAVPATVRRDMLAAAVEAARAVSYVGAGTVEFLLDGDTFHFIEMNTRLQVEHTVTEEITGLDLVEWQLRVASDEPLPLPQEGITATGASVQVRVYAEDPYRSFLPSPGALTVTQWPATRIEKAFDRHTAVTGDFDPMIAKLITTGATRREALAAAANACGDLRWSGISTNLGFVTHVLGLPVVRDAAHDTTTVDGIDPVRDLTDPDALAALAVATVLTAPERTTPWSVGAVSGDRQWLDPVDRALGLVQLSVDGPHAVTVVGYDGDAVRLKIVGAEEVSCSRVDARTVLVGGLECFVEHTGAAWTAQVSGVVRQVAKVSHDAVGGAAGGPEVNAPMPGTLVRLLVDPGAQVEAGQPLGVMEAMKMEHELLAPYAGRVATVGAAEGDIVTPDVAIFVVEAA